MPSLSSLETSAQDRIKQSFNDQKRVYQEVKRGSPFNAENEPSRKISWTSNQIGVSRQEARIIVEKKDLEHLSLDPVQRSKAESLQGDTIDFMGIQFLDLAVAASKAIARVTFRSGGASGTGFMVSPQLFLTNNHVIPDKASAMELMLEFNYQEDYQGSPLPYTRFELDPDTFFYTNRQDSLDFTLIAVGRKIDGPLALTDCGFLPLLNTNDKHIKGMFVNCVQHPNGMYKQLVVRENRLLTRTDNTLIYSSDTLPGASGSPVFNDDWEVVALHHWGGPYRAFMDMTEVPDDFPKIGNEGIRISAIVSVLQSISGLTPKATALLEAALTPESRYPTLIHAGSLPGVKENSAKIDSFQKQSFMHANEVKNEVAAVANAINGQVSFSVPLTITVQLGTIPAAVNFASKDPIALAVDNKTVNGNGNPVPVDAESLKPDLTYANRKGYNPDFLGRRVKLPRLTSEQKQLAAKNKMAGQSDDPYELKYQHFSIVMHKKRRLPFFTAVNIDGGSVVKINRQTGDVTRGPEFNNAEAREKWFDDDRIADNEICNDSLYLQEEMKIFQRGHLVKRTDPSWGTASKAVKGQADTFHFTNCSPQHKNFNPNKSRWAGVEDWITNTSDDENIRVTVFSGPVFDDADKRIDYLQIPKQYWKVVVWIENDTLHATGIIADQSDLLKASWGAEHLSVLPDKLPDEYHCSIDYIEELTQLKFGLPEEADTYPKAEGLEEKRKIASFDDILPRRSRVPYVNTP